MKIRKTFVGNLPDNKIINSNSTSGTDTYSCKYLNERNVIVSSEEPTTGEEVWIQKGKNLFDKNTVTNGYRLASDGKPYAEDSGVFLSDFIEVETGKIYATNWDVNIMEAVAFYDTNKNFLIRHTEGTSFEVTSAKYMRICGYQNNVATMSVEEGSITPKKIHTKTDNGYEEFYNEEYVSGAILYSNTNGFTDDLTLGKDLTKYKTLEIYYKDNDNRFSSVKVNVGDILISLYSVRFANSKLYVKTGTLTITYSNGSFNLGEQRETNFSSSGTTIGTDSTGKIYITKIVGNM